MKKTLLSSVIPVIPVITLETQYQLKTTNDRRNFKIKIDLLFIFS